MKVAIAGAGNVGTAIAKDLRANGHDVLLIEQDPDLVERLRPTLDVTWVAADACEVSSLVAAGHGRRRRGRGRHRRRRGQPGHLAAVQAGVRRPPGGGPGQPPDNQWLFNESWGVDVSVSTPQLLTALVEEAVSVGSLVRLLQFEGGRPTWWR